MIITSHNSGQAYVEACVSALRFALSKEDLLEWWKDEMPNRRKWRLSEAYPPGSELKEAFQAKLTELTQKETVT